MKMYKNVLEKVRDYEEKRGITYARPGGKLHKYIKALYLITFIYTLAMNMFFVIGVAMSDARMHSMSNTLYTVLALSIALILAFVLTIFKDKILPSFCSMGVNILACIGLVVTFAPLMENVTGGYKGAFFWRHLVPLCLLMVINFVLNIIITKANLKLRKTYKKIVDSVYSVHNTSIAEDSLDEDAWDEILKNI